MFDSLLRIWSGRPPLIRVLLLVAAAALLAGMLVLGIWLRQPEFEVLFANLEPRDGAAMVAELGRMKTPYRLDANGTAILVERSQVAATRLKLMGKGVDLHGTVGFEIFNSSDLGMTEFVQKVNYQRALEGELTRTIMALDEVRSVRVHLVLPEGGLLRRDDMHPKASITLALKPDRQIRPEAVAGIQRLVAAAVPEMDAGAVTVLDQTGVAVSRNPAPDRSASGIDGVPVPGSSSAAAIDPKAEVDGYLTRKVGTVLDRAFGPGQAIVSVDVTLNLDQVKVTREDVLPLAQVGGQAVGAITHKRTSSQGDVAATAPAGAGDVAPRSGAETSDVEYQNGRRVEQIVSQPGGIRRLSIGVLLPHQLEPARFEELKAVLGSAVGFQAARGDVIAITSIDQLGAPAALQQSGAAAPVQPSSNQLEAPVAIAPARAESAAADKGAEPVPAGPVPGSSGPSAWLAAAGLILLLAAGAVILQCRNRAAALSPEARAQLLADMQRWLAADERLPGVEERS